MKTIKQALYAKNSLRRKIKNVQGYLNIQIQGEELTIICHPSYVDYKNFKILYPMNTWMGMRVGGIHGNPSDY